jgi:hypothetical protein
MSTILDALEKAEEKRKASESLENNILHSRLGKSSPLQSHFYRWGLVSGVAAALVVLFFFWHTHSFRHTIKTGAPVREPAQVTEPLVEDMTVQAETVDTSEHVPPPAEAPFELNLSGILWDEKSPVAIINGKPLGVGGEIEGARVMEVGQESVLILYRGLERKLKLR